MRKILAAGLLAFLGLSAPALAQGVGSGSTMQASGVWLPPTPGSTLTRATGTSAYSANSIICPASGCAAGTINIAQTNAGKAAINRVNLLKSGSSTTSANFTIWFFGNAPTIPATDGLAYVGPYAADFGKLVGYLGSATCTTPNATNDGTAQVWFECSLSNPNSSGVSVASAAYGGTTIYYLISATAAYTPAASETFTPIVSGVY